MLDVVAWVQESMARGVVFYHILDQSGYYWYPVHVLQTTLQSFKENKNA